MNVRFNFWSLVAVYQFGRPVAAYATQPVDVKPSIWRLTDQQEFMRSAFATIKIEGRLGEVGKGMERELL